MMTAARRRHNTPGPMVALTALLLWGCPSSPPTDAPDAAATPAQDVGLAPEQARDVAAASDVASARDGALAAPDDPEPEPPMLPFPPLPSGQVSDARLHRAALVMDMHVDTLWRMHEQERGFGQPGPDAQVDRARILQGGLDAQVFSLWMPSRTREPFKEIMALIDLFEREILAADTGIARAGTATEALALHRRGLVAAMLSIEGAEALEGDPQRMRALHARGVRFAALTWNHSNPFGDGAKGSEHGGITEAGRALVGVMNELGVVVDVSHASPDTFWDVLTASARPVVATHSNASAIHPHARNLDDLQLWAIADSGGVVGLNFHGTFLGAGPKVGLVEVVAHARHMRAVMGAEHIGLGSDFDGGIHAPEGLGDVGALPSLTSALRRAGFLDEELVALLGTNILRVLHTSEVAPPQHRVTHRPLMATAQGASSNPEQAGVVLDASTRTAWSPAPEDTAPALRLKVTGPGLSRLVLCASSPGLPAPPTIATVVARPAGGGAAVERRVALSARLRPHVVELPGLEGAAEVEIEVRLEARGAAPPRLSIAAPMRRDPHAQVLDSP